MEISSAPQSLKIVPPDKTKCIWMEAGVVSYKLCYNNYDCPTCDYDHAMQHKVEQQRETASLQPVSIETGKEKFSATWVEKMMLLSADRRKCRYMLTGEVNRKICPNAYQCGNCSFDQMMQERLQAETLPAGELAESAGFKVVPDFYYHEGHAWARPEYGGRIRIGLDDFAQKLLGRLSGLRLPQIGEVINQGQNAFFLTRNGEMVSALSPVGGVVTHINQALLDQPELINQSPYEEGWLIIVEPTKLKKDLKSLYFGEGTLKLMAEEKDRLLEKAYSEMHISADGGQSVEDIAAQFKGERWSKIVRFFLRS